MTETILDRALRVLRDDGLGHLAREGAYFVAGEMVERYHKATGDYERGDIVFDDDWDVLVVLDACRTDLMRETLDDDRWSHEPQWDWAHKWSTRWSAGSSSEEFMRRSFTDEYAEEMAETAHITANVFSDSELDGESWGELDEVWRHGWDSDRGTTPARAVVDSAISSWRDDEYERMIVWLMQPHAPFFEAEWSWTGKTLDRAQSEWGSSDAQKTIWNRMRDGEVSRETVWDAYRDNLEYALDEVGRLLASIDAETVAVTSDHGNGLGERGIYGHPTGVASPELRKVPWIETTARDTGEFDPEDSNETDTDESVEERLQALGYHG